ncbi:MAG: hypothetical protein P1U69_15160 [Parvibaculaceae bacterium]|nr:hypothetical protein [Parvibaculaceae bacterium]|tara:strand:+ start:7095 stop:7352 length:258 start_codon:yes stop_codon:yes gene_type:complete
MFWPDLIGAAGVALLLGAFAANLLGMVEKESLAYPSANLVGASLATYASWLIAYMPFVVLEGVWACVSLIAVFRVMRQPKTAPSP